MKQTVVFGIVGMAGKLRFRSHIAAIVTACLLNLSGTVWADVDATQQNFVDGKVTRDGIDLFYRVVGPMIGDYVLVLSGGPGEDIHSMQGVADELGKKYRCIMWEQRGTGRSKLRSEEHTSELQSQSNLVCRLLLEKKKKSTPLPAASSPPTTPMRPGPSCALAAAVPAPPATRLPVGPGSASRLIAEFSVPAMSSSV